MNVRDDGQHQRLSESARYKLWLVLNEHPALERAAEDASGRDDTLVLGAWHCFEDT